MTSFTYLKPAICISALLGSTAVQADVTAQQVWDDWKADLSAYGADAISVGSEEMSGDTLTVSDIAFSSEGAEAVFALTMPQIAFTENGDGTVSVVLPAETPLTITSTLPEGPKNVVELALRQSGLTMTASGTPEALVYDVAADRYALELVEAREDGELLPGDALLALNMLDGRYDSTKDSKGGREIGYDISIGSLDLLLEVADPEAPVSLSGQIREMALKARTLLPAGLDLETPETALEQGLAASGTYAYGAAKYIFSGTEEGVTTAGTASVDSGTLAFGIDQQAVSYDTRTNGLEIAVTEGPLPFPLLITAAEYGLGLQLPLTKTDGPAEFSARVTLDQLAVNDEVWGMIDPTATLPHDPATLIAELSGTATLFEDLTDPAQAEAMTNSETVPAEINSLDLDRLSLSAAGASVEGEGGFVFDNSDTTTFDGFPRPEGKIELKINGLNGLIEKLTALGIVPADQVMGARMMLGLFTTPVGDDELTSTIEVNAEGHLMANGQRLQ